MTPSVQRVLLADDHTLFRDAIARLLSYEDDFEVVGEAADGDAAVRAARELMPDVVLMDVDMPGTGGIEATRRLKAEMPYMRVVMLTVHEDDATLFDAVKAGAQGYLVKSIRTTEMLAQLRAMTRGDAPLSRGLATRILSEFARMAHDEGASDATASSRVQDAAASGEARGIAAQAGADPTAALSLREQEVLELVAQRLTNKEIAARLVLSEYTVKNHLQNILSKLHLHSRAEAARLLLHRQSTERR